MIAMLDLSIIAALIAIAIIDARKLIIPDSLSLFIALAALLAVYLKSYEAMFDGGLGALMAFVLFEGTRRVMTWRLKREAMGFGDVKLMTAGGIWVGSLALPIAIVIGCCAAALAFIIFSMIKKVNLREHILPFGPFLAFGLIAAKYSELIFAW